MWRGGQCGLYSPVGDFQIKQSSGVKYKTSERTHEGSGLVSLLTRGRRTIWHIREEHSRVRAMRYLRLCREWTNRPGCD